MKLTLNRALRYKKRVVEAMRRLESDIQTNNSKPVEEDREVDVRQALDLRKQWIQHLIVLKLAIQQASLPIQAKIFRLAEAKSEIAFLERVPVHHGKSASRFREESQVVYEAIIRKVERDQMTFALQQEIDRLQTDIDAHNAQTAIEFGDPPVALL